MVWKKKDQWKTDFSDKYKQEKTFNFKPERAFKPNLNIPRISRSVLIPLVLVVMILVLAYFNFSTGSYISVLEEDKSTFQSQLDTCDTEKQTISSDLSSCNTELDTCNTGLSGKTSSLSTCESERTSCLDDLDLCEDDIGDLKLCESDLEDFTDICDRYNRDDPEDLEDYIEALRDDTDDLENDKDELQDDLSDCNSDKSSLQSNYDTLKGNYAKNKCCPLNIFYYRIVSNNVDCTNNTADTHITCP